MDKKIPVPKNRARGTHCLKFRHGMDLCLKIRHKTIPCWKHRKFRGQLLQTTLLQDAHTAEVAGNIVFHAAVEPIDD